MNSITRLPSRGGLMPPSAVSEPRGSETLMNNYSLFPYFFFPNFFISKSRNVG